MIFCCFQLWFILLLSAVHAKSKEGYKCKQNVPKTAKKALLGAINEERSKLGREDIVFNCSLAKNAFENVFEGSYLNAFEGESTFENTWEETLKKAMASIKNGMTNAANQIGCEIKLDSSPEDGSHKVKLDCHLGDLIGKPPVQVDQD